MKYIHALVVLCFVVVTSSAQWCFIFITVTSQWASYQIRKIAGCACAGNAGNVFPRRRFQRKLLVSDPGMHHGTCVTHVPWCMSGSLTCGDGENVPGIPSACAPAILRIWQEAHGHDSVSNHQPHDCLLNRLFRRRSKKTSKLRVTGLCAGNSPGNGEFPAQVASNVENVSIWWHYHVDNLLGFFRIISSTIGLRLHQWEVNLTNDRENDW